MFLSVVAPYWTVQRNDHKWWKLWMQTKSTATRWWRTRSCTVSENSLPFRFISVKLFFLKLTFHLSGWWEAASLLPLMLPKKIVSPCTRINQLCYLCFVLCCRTQLRHFPGFPLNNAIRSKRKTWVGKVKLTANRAAGERQKIHLQLEEAAAWEDLAWVVCSMDHMAVLVNMAEEESEVYVITMLLVQQFRSDDRFHPLL